MKENTFVIATVLAATTMLLAAFAVIPVEADQQSSSVNDCGNGDTPIDVFCQELTSQIIGYDNDVTIDADQGDD
jgi:hypothetical protein